MSVPHSSTEWPIAGGIYWHRSHATSVRVTSIDAGYVAGQYVHDSGVEGGMMSVVSVTVFRNCFLPEDQSPIPALVKALKGMIFSHFCDEDAGFDSVKVTCEFCREARAALASLARPAQRVRHAMRKVVQISVASPPHSDYCDNLYALCDDGSMWVQAGENKWTRILDIPQPKDQENEDAG